MKVKRIFFFKVDLLYILIKRQNVHCWAYMYIRVAPRKISISSTIGQSKAQKLKPKNMLCVCAYFFYGTQSIRNAAENYIKKKIGFFCCSFWATLMYISIVIIFLYMRIVISNVSFSPQSGGVVNPNTAMLKKIIVIVLFQVRLSLVRSLEVRKICLLLFYVIF